jgi:hypothetical protein
MARTERTRIKLQRAGCILVLASLAAGCVSLAAAAQDQRNSGAALPKAKDGPAPRTADGHPDLSGVWFPDMRQYAPPAVAAVAAKVPFQPWAAAKIKAMTPADLELARPSVNCSPRGVPGMFMADPYPVQLVQTRDELIQLDELNTNFRVIHTDGRPHPKDPDPTFAGDATAHWEGDTLVIDVIAIDERTWNNFIGWFHSDQEHVIEHLSRPSENSLVYQVTIEDPKVLTGPWTSEAHIWSLHHEDLEEYYCTNNHEVEQYKSLVEGANSGK